MKIEITARHFTVSRQLKELINEKIKKIENIIEKINFINYSTLAKNKKSPPSCPVSSILSRSGFWGKLLTT